MLCGCYNIFHQKSFLKETISKMFVDRIGFK